MGKALDCAQLQKNMTTFFSFSLELLKIIDSVITCSLIRETVKTNANVKDSAFGNGSSNVHGLHTLVLTPLARVISTIRELSLQ